MAMAAAVPLGLVGISLCTAEKKKPRERKLKIVIAHLFRKRREGHGICTHLRHVSAATLEFLNFFLVFFCCKSFHHFAKTKNVFMATTAPIAALVVDHVAASVMPAHVVKVRTASRRAPASKPLPPAQHGVSASSSASLLAPASPPHLVQRVGRFFSAERLVPSLVQELVKLNRFYTDAVIDQVLMPKIRPTNNSAGSTVNDQASLRLLEWFVLHYAKNHDLQLQSQPDQLPMHVYTSYALMSDQWSRKFVSPFRRQSGILYFAWQGRLERTTLGQLNFLAWVKEHGILDFVEANHAAIKSAMNVAKKQMRLQKGPGAAGSGCGDRRRRRRRRNLISTSAMVPCVCVPAYTQEAVLYQAKVLR